MPKFKDLTGQQFGYLKVLKKEKYSETAHSHLWECICDCGNKTIVSGTNLRTGHTTSCGCKKGKIIHNKYKTRLYVIYRNMKQRCYNAKKKEYKNYGGRGIIICSDWLSDFMIFYNWSINNGYSDNLTIDRIDVNGNYEPSNCRWVDHICQQNNMRTNRRITYKNETHTIAEWSRILKISPKLISDRLRNNSFEDILKKLNIIF